ncbi:MAG: rod shape-determining protein MreC [Patescibacteria group bacterium]|jgi:rod shape-determining protein MreC
MKYFNKKIAVIFVAAMIIILLHYAGALAVFENYILTFLKPAEKIAFNAGNKGGEFYNGQESYDELKKINEELEARNQKLLEENIGLKILEDENIALRNQLEFYSRHNYKKLVANITSREGGYGIEQIITIDKGRNDGVSPGQPVISDNGVIVGKIFAAEDSLSYAHLITDKQCQIAASSINKKETAGVTKGELGLTIQMNFIPQTEEVSVGEVIVTSGLEQQIPRGLIIGTVQEVKKEPNDLFQSIIINPALNLNTLSIVSIILN